MGAEYMNLEQRIDLLAELGGYCLSPDPGWIAAKERAFMENRWFLPEFIDGAVESIARGFLQKDLLWQWAEKYDLPAAAGTPAIATTVGPKTVGLIMAGNIPLVGFHDLLSVFISGNRQRIKPSTRDEVLIRHLVEHMISVNKEVGDWIEFAERLNGCDAYIATGSNNSARYFEYYFDKYPHIIRRNRTSVAVLNGRETSGELEALADDTYQYFGLGCRNVTKIFVPQNYDFIPLLEAFKKYNYLADHAKYKHNYDYQLTLLILNKKYYMSNESILLVENPSPFSPISVLNYEYYDPSSVGPNPVSVVANASQAAVSSLQTATLASHPPVNPSPGSSALDNIQCIVSQGLIPFGQAQHPGLSDYADGVDTLQFLKTL